MVGTVVPSTVFLLRRVSIPVSYTHLDVYKRQAPFYFTPNSVSSVLKFQVPTLKAVVAGLGSLGFECSLTHAKASSLKTDASWDAIWYVMKKYCIDNNLVNIEKMNKNGNGYKILTNDTIGQTEDWDKKISFEPCLLYTSRCV